MSVCVCVCGCVCPVLPPLQLLPQAFAVNKNVFSVSLPGYIRAKESFGVKKRMFISAQFRVMKCYFTQKMQRDMSSTQQGLDQSLI